MIVVSILGGLGNQMFQYAFGRAMATNLDRRLVLDLSRMPTGEPPFLRRFDLAQLSIAADVQMVGGGGRRMSREQHGNVRVRHGHRLVAAASKHLLRRWWVDEPIGDVVLDSAEIPDGLAVCHGYWQSPLYFDDIATNIRNELRPPLKKSSLAHEALVKCADRQTVAVHVRRGDYFRDMQTNAFHGVQDASYQAAAVESIAAKLGEDVVALVLSDDPTWAQEALDLGIETMHIEARQSLSALESLALMSRCQHHVIANSSFSWWGAWLAEHADQHVVYPELWFADQEIDTLFRFPRHWRSER